MEIDPGHRSFYLVKTDIVEALETRARYCPHAMIGNKEVFLPAHEYVITLSEIPVGEIWFLCPSGQRSPCLESCPMVHICFLGRTPWFMASFERVFGSDDFAFEEGRQSGMIFRQA